MDNSFLLIAYVGAIFLYMQLNTRKLKIISCRTYNTQSWWEKGLGPFFALIEFEKTTDFKPSDPPPGAQDFSEFIKNWTEYFKANHNSFFSLIKSLFYMMALVGGLQNDELVWFPILLSWFLTYRFMQKLGNFPVWSLPLVPFNVGLYLVLKIRSYFV